jgi:hypothetical protein
VALFKSMLAHGLPRFELRLKSIELETVSVRQFISLASYEMRIRR